MTNTFKQTHRKLTAISHCESPCELSVSMVVAHIFIGDEHAGVYDEDVPNFHTNRCLTDRNCMYKLPIVLHFSLFHHIALTGFFNTRTMGTVELCDTLALLGDQNNMLQLSL